MKAARPLKRLTAVLLCHSMLLLCLGPQAAAAGNHALQTAGAKVSAVDMVIPMALSLGHIESPALQARLLGSIMTAPPAPSQFTTQSAPGSAGIASAGIGSAAGLEEIARPLPQASFTVIPALALTVNGPEASGLDSAWAPAEGLRVAAKPLASRRAIGRVIDSVRFAFASKQDPGTLPASPVDAETHAGQSPAAHLGAHPAQAPPAPPEPPAPPTKRGDSAGGGWLGIGAAAVTFIAALLAMQVGVEALGAAMPTLVQKVFGDFTIVAQLAIFSAVAGIVGRTMAPVFIQKSGLRAVYLASQIARLASISALCALLATGHMTLPLMMGFYSLNGLLGGVALTAETSIPPLLVGQDIAKIEKFWTIEQTLLETIGISGPILTGMVVAHYGFLPALIAYPVSFALAIAILIATLRIPAKVEAMRLADLKASPAALKAVGLGSVFGDFFKKIGQGAKLVWEAPALRYTFLAFTAYVALNPFLYSLLAPAYALRLVANPEAATSVAGWLTGLYSLGGLLGGLIMLIEQKRIAKQLGPEPSEEGPAKEQYKARVWEILRPSMLRWMKLGTLGLLAIGTLAFPSPLLLGALTLPALALIPFGVAQVITTLKLKSFFQFKVLQLQKNMDDAMGFFGAASLSVSTAGLLLLKYVFKFNAGFTPFWWIAAAMVPLALCYVWLTRRMAKVSKV